MIIKNGNIHDAVHEEVYVADIALRDGKIAAIGKDIAPLAGEEILDAAGKEVYPGFVDAHSHLGLHGFGLGKDPTDVNERGDRVGAHMRAIDAFDPHDEYLRRALRGGVTTICTGPGSANFFGGTFMVVKTAEDSLKNMVVREGVAMKCAFGENPKKSEKKYMTSRMGVAAVIRQTLYDATDYMLRKEDAEKDPSKRMKTDLRMEALIPVLKREIPIKAHVHRADDIWTAIRIAKEFNLKMTLEHVTDGRNAVEEMVEAGFPVAAGPVLFRTPKLECVNRSFATAAVLSKAGLKVSLITDAPVMDPELLPLCAGFAIKEGMDPHKALQAITITAAEHIGAEDRVGSLEVGKDADVVIADGNLLTSVVAKVEAVFVSGKKVVG